MRLPFIKIAVFLLTCSVATCVSAKITGLSEVQDQKQIEASITKLKSQIAKLNRDIESDAAHESQLNLKLKETEVRIGQKSEQLRQINNNYTDTQKDLKSLKQDIKELKKSEKDIIAQLEDFIIHKSRTYKKERLELLFTQNELNTLGRLNQYYRYYTAHQKHQVIEIHDYLSNLYDKEEALVRATSKLLALKEKEDLAHQALIKENKAREALISEIHAKLGQNQSQLSHLNQEQEKLELFLKKLQKRLAVTPNYIDVPQDFSKMRGKLTLPIDGPHAQLKTLPHVLRAQNTRTKQSYVHAEEGTDVHAVYPGRVVFSEWLRGIGLLLIVDHGNGYMSLYGNNQTLYKDTGDWVNMREVIAKVGKSGGKQTPGLYFELRKDGQPLDPKKWLKTNS